MNGGQVKFFIDFDYDYDFAASESIGSVPVVDGEAKLPITPEIMSKIDLKQYYDVLAVYSGDGYIDGQEWGEFTFSNTTISVQYE